MLNDLIRQIVDYPLPSLAVIGNLVIIESLLSVDNAAVLATLVMDLPLELRNRALKYGIIGAYLFRGLAMLFASFLVKIWWLKPLGGIYLLYLVYDWWKGKRTDTTEDDVLDKKSNILYKLTVGKIGSFWATVAIVEVMDMAFSIDYVFAAVAYTPNIILICTGVFIGIFAMRFIAQWFVSLMSKFPFLETSAFVVIAILGIKLFLSIFEHLYPQTNIAEMLNGNMVDGIVSVITVIIFFMPLLSSLFFNIPKRFL